MATFEEGLFQFLDLRPEFRALNFANGAFFDGTHCRIYPGTIAEESLLPALAYLRVGGSSSLNMAGGDGVKRARIQFTAAGIIYADPAILIGVLSGVPGAPGILDGFAGAFPNGVVVQLARPLMEPIDAYVAEVALYTRHVDFEFLYQI
jgi:hypothetical protein